MGYTGGSEDTRTDDDFFRIGFLGLEDTPKYAFTEKADDKVKNQLFNLLDYKTPQARIDAFKEIQERSARRNEGAEFHAVRRPEDKKVELDPNVRIIPTPNLDYSKQWHAAEQRKPIKMTDKELAEGVSNTWNITGKVADTIEEPYRMYEKMRKALSNPTAVNISHTASAGISVRSLSNTVDGSHILSKVVKNGGKAVSRVSAATGIVSALDFSASTWADYEESGDLVDAVAQNVIRVGASEGAAVLGGKAGMQVGAYIGSLICPFAGTLIGGAIGYLGGRLIGGWIGDEVGDSLGEWVVGWFD